MIQATHIFQKDVRHLWPELGVYSVFLVVYSWAEPLTWQIRTDSPATAGWANLLLSILRPLLVLLWLVIVSRLIHDESLVGDRQFWITKPYNRLSLVAAKFLFVAVCIILPFCLMEMYLIVHAGLGVRAAMPGMLRNLRSFGLVCWLPLLALACVTASLSRMLLAAMGTFLGFFLFTLIVTLNLLSSRATPPFVGSAISALFALVVISTFLFQYVARHTVASRVLLIAVFVTVGVLHSTPPSNLLYKLRYPSEPRHLQYKPTNRETGAAQLKRIYGKYVLTIPIQTEDRSDGSDGGSTSYDQVASSYTIDGPDVHYESGWQPAGFNPDGVSMYIASNLVEELSGRQVKLHINLVGRKLDPITTSSVDIAGGFSVPGGGHCLVDRVQTRSILVCRYAFASPPRTVLREASERSIATVNASPGYVLRASASSPAFDPIAQAEVELRVPPKATSSLSVVAYQSTRDLHISVEADDVDISKYVSDGIQ